MFRPTQHIRLARSALLVLLVPMLLCLEAAAAQSREAILVSTDWLKQHINDADLVLLHVGDKADYDAGHIAGARQITMADLAAPEPADHMSGESLELPSPEAARARLEVLGVNDRSRIVVYHNRGSIPGATRIIFTLDWLGLGDRAALLDGGMAAWTRSGGPATTETTPVVSGRLTLRPVKKSTVTKEWLIENRGKPGFTLIDARAPVFYDGTRSGMSKSGHIPGAKNIPFTSVNDDTQRIKSRAELQLLFTSAGIKPGDTVVAYCHIGMQATAVLFAARTLGYRVLLYDGSFHDWEKHDLPVETKSGSGR
jgi:thiosulfate/3-mercaptopyruvate sulfurtransferase